MKKLIVAFSVVFLGCTKESSNIPAESKLNFECNWTTNAYYVLKINGKTIAVSSDSTNTTLNRPHDFVYKSGDFVELVVKSLDSLGVPDKSRVHGAIIIDGYRVQSNTAYGRVDLIY